MLDYKIPNYISDELEADAREEEFDNTHKKCPICGGPMDLQSEEYNLGHKYIDEWYECRECGYCLN